jgi:mono/diheme cytochrome c family protein
MQSVIRFMLLAFVIIFQLASCSDNEKSVDGKSIYTKYCIHCHGVDGKLQLNNAADLSKSALLENDVVKVVSDGRQTMQPFKTVLHEHQIKMVSEYIMDFRQNAK